MAELTYPVRINHYLALEKICSRRMADILIGQGKVKINGRPAVLGQKVERGDSVTVDREIQDNLRQNRVFLAYNKPVGVITHGPQHNEKSIADVLAFKSKLFPIGRLDKDSHGLIILTNDGRITDRLLNPKYEHDKEYVVKVNKTVRPGFLRHLQEGITLENYQTKPAAAEKLSDTSFRIVLTEGKNRQIRKMCAAFNYQVLDLKRVRIMNIRLDNLKQNQYRTLKGQELQKFLTSLGL
jgi:23S rRNA pseudouridine2604 synthase